MKVAKRFRRFLLGGQYVQSRAAFKRIVLTGYLAMLCMVVNVLYMVVDSHQGHYVFSWLNVFCFATSLASIFLIRYRKFITAKLILFIGAKAVVFAFCALEPFGTGVHFFLVLISVGAIALFGIEEWRYAAGLSILAAVIFLVTVVADFKIAHIEFSADYVSYNFILNFLVILTAAVMILYFMIDLNHYAEKTLEKKEAETREKNKELTKLNTELDRFVYSVSHDLRSPLSTISGLVHIGSHAENLEEAKKYFAMIGDRIQAQDFFIREIIDFYRNSRTDISQEKFLLREQVNEIVNQHVISQSSIQYQINIPDSLELYSDKIRIKSVLSNLIGNAIKYHDLTKAEKFIKISGERQNGHWVIAVEDNGLGIAADHLPKVFDMFYRASADSKGSGLGLFIARETVDKLGGKIHVDSKLGQGTRFWFTFTAPAEA